MKKLVILFGSFLLMQLKVLSQNNNNSPAEQMASKIAKKMKDTLNLTGQQRNQIYTINMYLHNKKAAVRQQFSNPDDIRINTQRIENKRDSLYRTILSEEKYLLYREKKKNLVTGN